MLHIQQRHSLPRRIKRRGTRSQPIINPVQAARAAGLRYCTDASQGISRQRHGRGFTYHWPDGATVRDRPTRARIKSLAVPPAWTAVWICPDARGHLQATGRDAKGRKQYRYHPLWRAFRDDTKFGRMVAFGEALPGLRAHLARDIERGGFTREHVLATVLRLLDTTCIRVGNEEYARDNHSFGLTTLRTRHVRVRGSIIRFAFRGKSGQRHDVTIHDRRLARIVARCQDLPGHLLFEYLESDGQVHGISSDDVNARLRELTGSDFTAKDFRTWSGTVLVARALCDLGAADSATQAKHNIAAAIGVAARHLGNTPAICRKSYVHPGIIAAYEEGIVVGGAASHDEASAPLHPPTTELSDDERAVLQMLRHPRVHPQARAGGQARAG